MQSPLQEIEALNEKSPSLGLDTLYSRVALQLASRPR
jgi:hypothetical protein